MEDVRVRFTIKDPSGDVTFSRKDEIRCKEVMEKLSVKLNNWEQQLRHSAANILIKGHTNSEIAASLDVIFLTETKKS
jgi:hypothetical protein